MTVGSGSEGLPDKDHDRNNCSDCQGVDERGLGVGYGFYLDGQDEPDGQDFGWGVHPHPNPLPSRERGRNCRFTWMDRIFGGAGVITLTPTLSHQGRGGRDGFLHRWTGFFGCVQPQRDCHVPRQARDERALLAMTVKAQDAWGGALAALQHEFGDAFADHHGGDVGVGPDAVGHDGRIDDADAVQSMDLAELVNHGHGI